MPVCCRCNGSGRCKNCSCSRSGTACTDCLPSKRGRCRNTRQEPTLASDLERTKHASQQMPAPDSDHEEGISQPRLMSASDPDLEQPQTAHTSEQVRALPQFNPMSCDNASWQTRTGREFSDAIEDAYSQVVHWKRNLFMVPSGAQGK